MKVAILKEKANGEARVSATPDTVSELIALGLEVHVEKGAGVQAGFPDSEYVSAGASIAEDATKAIKPADLILKVQPPSIAEISTMKKSAVLVGLLASNESAQKKYAEQGISAFALEMIPRITRAQGMDVLSSQSNIAGYKAVIDAVYEFGKVIPMMVTAAGTIKPAKVMVMGAGVAGLQAIATARRLGAIVCAFDVRTVAKEQVESLGATFIEVDASEDAETKGGYAKEASAAYKKKQAELVHNTIKDQDIVITTALIPGKPAPNLITEKMIKDMQPGSVIVDLAVIAGGNCAGVEKNKIITKHGVKIIGYENFAARVARDASRLYARNILNFIRPMVNKKLKRIKIDFEDDIIQATLIAHGGKIVNPSAKKTGKK